ncbi:MAG: ABC transporter ATP-binding protein [Candidatus Aminicenantes bacterium 4484_214]|nr:MAG: ABC transporter ATP-binding protein [Candidatus Aminicenantes bacterium 4484_214]
MISFVDVHKSFRDNHVLRGVFLDIEKGEIRVICGQSGSGKSVLIKNLIGLMKPDKGQIFVDGLEVTSLSEEALFQVRRKFGLLFQNAALFDSLTVAENVSFGLERYTDLSPGEIRRRVTESLEMVGLRGVENLMPHELSGGMKKRVGLARAIAYRPEIILYDEPSTGIDPIRTSIVITHDMISAYKVADRISMLYQGKIIETGTPGEIKKSSNPVVQQFITGSAVGPIKEF